MRREGGFSLIELLVVMAIIAILSTVGSIAYMKYMSNAKYAKMEQTLREAVLIAEDVFSEYSVYPSGSCDALATSDKVCSVTNSSGSIIVASGSGMFSFKVPSKMKLEFKPVGSNDIQVILTSTLLPASSSVSQSARLVYDGRTSKFDISCFDDSIHGKKWPSGCP